MEFRAYVEFNDGRVEFYYRPTRLGAVRKYNALVRTTEDWREIGWEIKESSHRYGIMTWNEEVTSLPAPVAA